MAKTIKQAGPGAVRASAATPSAAAGGRGGRRSDAGAQARRGERADKRGAGAPARQSGGTVLGIIIGLIVGLGIAVVVAVMITKTTLPFTNKQAQPERPAGVANGGQIADPNKPLYGNKEPSREAAKNFNRPAAPENAVIADAKPPGAEQTAAEKASEREAARIMGSPADKPADKPSAADRALADARMTDKAARADKSADKTADRNADKSADKLALAKPAPADEKWIYYLQAGAFRESSDAENAKAKLALMGFEANISERPSDSGPLYRVRVGPFNQLEVMTRARSKLSDNGVDVAVVRTAR